MAEERKETFEEFRRSLNYGTRADLLFKVLGGPNLGDGEVAEFFRGLLELLGDAFDTGDYETIRGYCFRWQVKGYTPREGTPPQFKYDSAPWTALAKPLNQARLALISTGGVFVEGHDPLGPNGPTQQEAVLRIQEFLRGDPALATIPRDTPAPRLRVRHPGYDIRGALRDHNVVFPLDHLKALEEEGVIGELANEAYSFVGATSQIRLLKEHAPRWAGHLKDKEVDAALLVAA
jgi:glycine/sarcosine/betaine reductase selenoprotein B